MLLYLFVSSPIPIRGQNNFEKHIINTGITEVAIVQLISEPPDCIIHSVPAEGGSTIRFKIERYNSEIWNNYSSIVNVNSLLRKSVATIQNDFLQDCNYGWKLRRHQVMGGESRLILRSDIFSRGANRSNY